MKDLQSEGVVSVSDSNLPVVLIGNRFEKNEGTQGVVVITSDVSEEVPHKSRNKRK